MKCDGSKYKCYLTLEKRQKDWGKPKRGVIWAVIQLWESRVQFWDTLSEEQQPETHKRYFTSLRFYSFMEGLPSMNSALNWSSPQSKLGMVMHSTPRTWVVEVRNQKFKTSLGYKRNGLKIKRIPRKYCLEWWML